MLTNKDLRIIIIVVLLGIFAVVALSYYNGRDSRNTLGDSVNEVVEEIEDEIDDNTTSR